MSSSKSRLLEAKKTELELKKAKKKMEADLPHLYGHKFYKWQRQFVDSTNRMNLLTAANQIRQPASEEDVNDTVDAVGFDFIRPPVVEYEVSQ